MVSKFSVFTDLPDGLIDAGNPPSHVDIKLGDVLLVCGVTEELFLHGVQLLLHEDHGERAGLDGQALPNVRHAIIQPGHTLLLLRLLVV